MEFNQWKQDMTDQKLSLKEARELWVKKYWTGKPCIRGHVSYRRTTDSRCRECETSKRRYKQFPEANNGRSDGIDRGMSDLDIKRIERELSGY